VKLGAEEQKNFIPLCLSKIHTFKLKIQFEFEVIRQWCDRQRSSLPIPIFCHSYKMTKIKYKKYKTKNKI
jgi:hypothetical protein